MRTFRTIAVLLLLALAGGPVLLDRCLVSCHEAAPAGAPVPSCHEHAAPADTSSRITGVEHCGHDHDTIDAERVSDVRTGAGVQIVPVALAPDVDPFPPVADPGACLRIGPPGYHRARVPVDRPLRV